MSLVFVLAVYAAVGARRRMPELVANARNAAFGVVGMLTLAIGILVYLLVTGHYQTKYAFEVSN